MSRLPLLLSAPRGISLSSATNTLEKRRPITLRALVDARRLSPVRVGLAAAGGRLIAERRDLRPAHCRFGELAEGARRWELMRQDYLGD
jgi:hypothetical protein